MKFIWGPYNVSQGLVHSSFNHPSILRCPVFACSTLSGGDMSLLRSAAQPSSSGKALPHSIKHHGWQSNKQYLMQRTMCAVTENLVGNTNIETAPMPKTRRLILLRHAKSSWEDASLKVMQHEHVKHFRLCKSM